MDCSICSILVLTIFTSYLYIYLSIYLLLIAILSSSNFLFLKVFLISSFFMLSNAFSSSMKRTCSSLLCMITFSLALHQLDRNIYLILCYFLNSLSCSYYTFRLSFPYIHSNLLVFYYIVIFCHIHFSLFPSLSIFQLPFFEIP